MMYLVLADLHFVDYKVWQKFLEIDHTQFDMVLLLGDIDIMFLKSISENFADKPIVGVIGNHDYKGDLEYYGLPNIHGKTVAVDGFLLSGMEGSLRYKKGDFPLYTQEEATTIIERFAYRDIIISHNSPFAVHNRDTSVHQGFVGWNSYIEKHKPTYFLHGHQHINQVTQCHRTKIIGVYGGILLNSKTGDIEKVLDLDMNE